MNLYINILMIIFHSFQYYFVHRYADQILIGNDILVEKNNKLTPAKVISISSVKAQGKYQQFLIFILSSLHC